MQSLPHLPDFLGNMLFHMARNFGHHHNDYTNHPIPKKRRPKRKALKTDKKRRTLGCAVKLSGIVNKLFLASFFLIVLSNMTCIISKKQYR